MPQTKTKKTNFLFKLKLIGISLLHTNKLNSMKFIIIIIIIIITTIIILNLEQRFDFAA